MSSGENPRFCSKCGQRSEKDLFCHRCGNPFSDGQLMSVQTLGDASLPSFPSLSRLNRRRNVLAVAVALTGLMALAVALPLTFEQRTELAGTPVLFSRECQKYLQMV